MTKYPALMTNSGPSHILLPVPFCVLGEWYPYAHHVVIPIAAVIVSRDILQKRTLVLVSTECCTIGGGK